MCGRSLAYLSAAPAAHLGQHRSTQRKVPQGRADEERLTDDIIELADQYGRYGYRMVTGLLNNAGWCVNHKRVERIWRREGLKVPQKQKKKGTALAERRLLRPARPERPNHVWSYDFVQDRTADGRVYRTLNIIDEYTREALMIRVDRKLNSTDVLDALTDLFILRGPPEYIRSDNGPEFIAQKVSSRTQLFAEKYWVPKRSLPATCAASMAAG
jgi:putative transposase